jgi:hypothetical protein
LTDGLSHVFPGTFFVPLLSSYPSSMKRAPFAPETIFPEVLRTNKGILAKILQMGRDETSLTSGDG